MERIDTSENEGVLDWFSEKEIKKITYEDIPPLAVKKFEGYSKRFVLHTEYIPQNFSGLYMVKYNSDETAYVALQKKVFKKDTGDEVHDCMYLYEEKSDAYLGHAEIFLVENEPFAQIGFTETGKEFHKMGYGFRRILLLNALTQFIYKKPLASSTLFVEAFVEGEKNIRPSKKIWEKLVQYNVAKATKRNKHDSYIVLTLKKTQKAINNIISERF